MIDLEFRPYRAWKFQCLRTAKRVDAIQEGGARLAFQSEHRGPGGARSPEGPVPPVVVPDDITRRTESEVKRKLARELHDSVAQILTLMVVDMENFKLDQAGQDVVVEKVDSLQESTREVLNNLRQVLYDLREEPSTESGFVQQVRALLLRFEG